METDNIEALLMQVSQGDRAAFRALFFEAGPAMAARLGFEGVDPLTAESALVETFAEIWEGEYGAPLRPGQSLSEWLGRLAVNHAKAKQAEPTTPVETSEVLWAKVAKRAYPESWRNILKRTDLLFGVAAAVVWAVILLLVSPR